jgi:hypothetical protein
MTHKVYIDEIRQELSIPPTRLDQVTWSRHVPQTLKDELKAAQEELFGEWGGKVEPESYRMCW